MPLALLLAMQAAGMIVDYLGTKNQQDMANMGAKIQQAGIEANIEQTRLETEDESLRMLQNLRQTLGSQAALYAARGQRAGVGSALAITENTIGTANADERTLRLNQRGKENALKAGLVISKLDQMGNNSKLWQGFAQRTINRIPIGALSSGGGGGGAFGASSARATGSFGLTQRS